MKIPPRLANHDELALCHSRKYIQLAEREIFEGFHELSTGDTVISPKSLDAALRATGQALNAVDAIVDKRVSNAISIGRPPGHHANARARDGLLHLQHHCHRGALRAAQAWHRTRSDRRLGCPSRQRHPGYFLYRRQVFFFSTHQSPWYPGTGARSECGEGAGEGMTLNCPFPAGSGRQEILGAFQEQLITAADEVKPEFVLISAGFDSRSAIRWANSCSPMMTSRI